MLWDVQVAIWCVSSIWWCGRTRDAESSCYIRLRLPTQTFTYNFFDSSSWFWLPTMNTAYECDVWLILPPSSDSGSWALLSRLFSSPILDSDYASKIACMLRFFYEVKRSNILKDYTKRLRLENTIQYRNKYTKHIRMLHFLTSISYSLSVLSFFFSTPISKPDYFFHFLSSPIPDYESLVTVFLFKSSRKLTPVLTLFQRVKRIS